MQDIQNKERRRSRRVRMGQSVHLCPTDPNDEQFEETCTTANASRDGVYFLTQRSSYYPGMRLFVTVPFHSRDSPTNKNYLGQVARVVELEDGKRGIGVQLLSSISESAKSSLPPRRF